MKNRTAVALGAVLIIVGVFSIFDALFDINLWSFVLPLFLIAIGFLILFKPKSISANSEFILQFVNENNETTPWIIKPAEYLSFVTDLKWDLSKATILEGETIIRMNSFVNEVNIILPQDAGVKISAKGIVQDTRIMGSKQDHIFAPFEYETPDYNLQQKQIFLQLIGFVSEVKIDQPG